MIIGCGDVNDLNLSGQIITMLTDSEKHPFYAINDVKSWRANDSLMTAALLAKFLMA